MTGSWSCIAISTQCRKRTPPERYLFVLVFDAVVLDRTGSAFRAGCRRRADGVIDAALRCGHDHVLVGYGDMFRRILRIILRRVASWRIWGARGCRSFGRFGELEIQASEDRSWLELVTVEVIEFS